MMFLRSGAAVLDMVNDESSQRGLEDTGSEKSAIIAGRNGRIARIASGEASECGTVSSFNAASTVLAGLEL